MQPPDTRSNIWLTDPLRYVQNFLNIIKSRSKCLRYNKLTLNIKKSQYMIVSNKRNISPITVKINNIPLVNCESYKYLGIHFDQKLSWNTHISNISTKIAKACGMLTKLRHFVPIEILIDVFYALIHSYLRYGILVWGNASNSSSFLGATQGIDN